MSDNLTYAGWLGGDIARATQKGTPKSQIVIVDGGGGSSTEDLLRTPNVFKDVNGTTITTITTVWTPASGKKIRLLGGHVSVSASGSVLFEDNSSSNFVFRLPVMPANTPTPFDLPGNGVLLSVADHVLKATGSVAMVITGTLWGCEE